MRRWQKLIVGLGAAAAVLLAIIPVSGCGSVKATVDPFVGTWGTPGSGSAWLVVAKTSDGYLLTLLPADNGSVIITKPPSDPIHQVLLTRQGNKLVGEFKSPAKVGAVMGRVEVVFLPESGHLTYENLDSQGPSHDPPELSKVSESTAIPTASPQ